MSGGPWPALGVQIDDRETTTDCVVGPPRTEPRIGTWVLTLLDPVARIPARGRTSGTACSSTRIPRVSPEHTIVCPGDVAHPAAFGDEDLVEQLRACQLREPRGHESVRGRAVAATVAEA